MNWRRGFFRLWIATSAVWVLIMLWSIDMPSCLLGFDLTATGERFWCPELPDAPMSSDAFDWEKAQAIAIEMLAERQAGQQQIEGFDVEAALAEAARLYESRQGQREQGDRLEYPWSRLGLYAASVLGPPIGLLLIGGAVGWVFGGFRRKDSEGPGSNGGP